MNYTINTFICLFLGSFLIDLHLPNPQTIVILYQSPHMEISTDKHYMHDYEPDNWPTSNTFRAKYDQISELIRNTFEISSSDRLTMPVSQYLSVVSINTYFYIVYSFPKKWTSNKLAHFKQEIHTWNNQAANNVLCICVYIYVCVRVYRKPSNDLEPIFEYTNAIILYI